MHSESEAIQNCPATARYQLQWIKTRQSHPTVAHFGMQNAGLSWRTLRAVQLRFAPPPLNEFEAIDEPVPTSDQLPAELLPSCPLEEWHWRNSGLEANIQEQNLPRLFGRRMCFLHHQQSGADCLRNTAADLHAFRGTLLGVDARNSHHHSLILRCKIDWDPPF